MLSSALTAVGLSTSTFMTTLGIQKLISKDPFCLYVASKIAHTHLTLNLTSLFAHDPHSTFINCAVVVADSVTIQLINAISTRTLGSTAEMAIEATLFGALAASGCSMPKVIISRTAFTVIMTELFYLRKTHPIRA